MYSNSSIVANFGPIFLEKLTLSDLIGAATGISPNV